MGKLGFGLIMVTMPFAWCSQAVADEPPTVESPRVKKVMRILSAVDLDDPMVRELVSNVDGRVKGKYLTFNEERLAGGTLKLHYQLSGGVGLDQVELKFQPDDSNFAYTARREAVMAQYQLKF